MGVFIIILFCFGGYSVDRLDARKITEDMRQNKLILASRTDNSKTAPRDQQIGKKQTTSDERGIGEISLLPPCFDRTFQDNK